MVRVAGMSIGVDADAEQFDAEMRDIHDDIDRLRDRIERPLLLGGRGGGGGGGFGGLADLASGGAVAGLVAAGAAVAAIGAGVATTVGNIKDLEAEAESLGLTLQELSGGRITDEVAGSIDMIKDDVSVIGREFKIMTTVLAGPFINALNDIVHETAVWLTGSEEALAAEKARIEAAKQRPIIQKAFNDQLKIEERLHQDIERSIERQEQRRQFEAIDQQMRAELAGLSREQFMAGQERRREEMFRTSGRSARAIEFELAKQLEAFNERERFAQRRQQIRDTAGAEKQMIRDQAETAKFTERSAAASEALLQLEQQRAANAIQLAITSEVR